jgi:hypothetical protein
MDDARRWADKHRNRSSILKIASEEGVDPGTVSAWLRKVGVEVRQGQHFIAQPALEIPNALESFISNGPQEVWDCLKQRVFGLRATRFGLDQLAKYTSFVHFYREGKGVEEIARLLSIHRSTVRLWRKGLDIPHLAKVAVNAMKIPRVGWQWLPLSISAGGNEFRDWVQVPTTIENYSDLQDVLKQLHSIESAYGGAVTLGLDRNLPDASKLDLFAYLLGFMLGDAGKLFGAQERLVSMNLDLQLSQNEATNLRLGEFVRLCVNSLGIPMERIADKQPSGDTLRSESPMPAFRWCSSRSPLIAWMFAVCLGLDPASRTSYDKVNMRWILKTPRNFRKRFIQGLADSDGSIKGYEFEIASMPNSEFVTELLASLGLPGARTAFEAGMPMRSRLSARVAATLPVFNEWVRGYRYLRLLRFKQIDSKKTFPS